MAFFSFFKTPRHQQFKYVPRYYDPRKEKLNEILGRSGDQELSDVEMAKLRIQRNFKSRATPSEYAKKTRRRSNILLLAIIFILLFLSYIFLSLYLPKFMQFVEG